MSRSATIPARLWPVCTVGDTVWSTPLPLMAAGWESTATAGRDMVCTHIYITQVKAHEDNHLPQNFYIGFNKEDFCKGVVRGNITRRQSAKPHCSTSQIHTHTCRNLDILTVPAAMGMENAGVQGHFKYSAAWGSPLSMHRILLLAQALKHTHKRMRATTHCR